MPGLTMLELPEDVCALTMNILRQPGGTFRLVDKEDEPPLRKLVHGIDGEYAEMKAGQNRPPYPYMLERDGKWFHGYRFDQDMCDQVLHETPELVSRFGKGDKAADVFFRRTLGYAAAGGELECGNAAADALVERLQEILAPAASRAFPGADEAGAAPRVYSIYANALLPGHLINLHLDVPEFAGLDRSTTPNWLLVAAHCSGLFDEYRVRNCTCVFYPRSANGGSLAIYPPQDASPGEASGSAAASDEAALLEPLIQQVRAGDTIAFDADSCFHHSEVALPAGDSGCKPLNPPQLPEKASFAARRVDGKWEWVVRDSANNIVSVHPEGDIRFTISCKLRVLPSRIEPIDSATGATALPDPPERMARKKPLDVSMMIAMLAQELQRRGRINVDRDPASIPLVDLAPLMVDEFVKPRCPSRDVVRQLWAST